MIDRTAEDINQDQRIGKLEREATNAIEAQAARILKLEQRQREILDLCGSHTVLLTRHESALKELSPLKVLIEHIETVKSFFTPIAGMTKK